GGRGRGLRWRRGVARQGARDGVEGQTRPIRVKQETPCLHPTQPSLSRGGLLHLLTHRAHSIPAPSAPAGYPPLPAPTTRRDNPSAPRLRRPRPRPPHRPIST